MKEYYIVSTKYNISERKTAGNGKVYDIRFRIIDATTGREVNKRLSGFANKTLAKQAYAEFTRNNCELVRDNPFRRPDTNQPVKEIPTVEELSTEYFAVKAGQCKDQSLYDIRSTFNNHVLPVFGNNKITELTTESLYRWQDSLMQKTKPSGERFSYSRIKTIRAFFNTFLIWVQRRYGYENNLAKVEPMRKASAPKKMKYQIWTEDQFRQFISVVDDDTYRCFFSLLFYTGKRKGEIMALSPADVKDGFLQISKTITRKSLNRAEGETYTVTPTKAYKDDLLPICPAAQRALNEYMKTDSYNSKSRYLFGGDRPLPEMSVSRAFKKYTQKAGLPEIRIHDLRHSFVSMLLHHGANFTVVADLINDTIQQVTKTYAHMYDADRISVLSSIK